MKRQERRLLGISIVVCLLLTTFLFPADGFAQTNTSKIQATVSVNPVFQFGGIDQYETAAKIAEAGWPENSDAIILSAGTQSNLIDAMSAGPLAALINAPILLTDESDQLNQYALAEITRLKPTKAYITSGQAVIKSAVMSELKSMGVTPIELGGYDQYETSINIAKKMQQLGNNVTKIAVVAGWVSPADALSIGSIAASKHMPIIATAKSELPAKVKGYLDSVQNSITDCYVIGGAAVVSDTVMNSLPGNKVRYSGNTKYDTNLDVLKKFADDLKYEAYFVANGETLVDALAGVPLAAQAFAPIVLTDKTIDPSILDYAKSHLSPNVIALGGEAVVTKGILNQLSSYDIQTDSNNIVGGQDSDTPEELENTLILAGDNTTLQNTTGDYSVYVLGENDTLKNITIKGTIFINPKNNGSVSLQNVTATQIIVLSGAEKGIHLQDVKADTLRVVSSSNIEIAPTGNSSFSSISVSSNAKMDASQGTWGTMHVINTNSAETIVELKGAFPKTVFVASAATVKTNEKASVAKLMVMPQDQGPIILDGTFNVVQVEHKADLALTSTSVLNNLVTHAKTNLDVAKGAQVGHLYIGNFGDLTGEGVADLPIVDPSDPYPSLNPEVSQTTDPSIGITYPREGESLPYGDVNITWTAAPGASGYAVVVSDLDNPVAYLRDYTINVSDDTNSFKLTTDHINSGHRYVITVYIIKPADPDAGYSVPSYMPKVNVKIGENQVSALTIKSPVKDAIFVQGTPVMLEWDAPVDTTNLSRDIFMTFENGTITYDALNGSQIRQYLLTPGKHHLIVTFRDGDRIVYQASTDFTVVTR